MNIRILLTCLAILTCLAGKTQMSISFDPEIDTILIGDQFTLKISITSNPNEYIFFPEFKGKDAGEDLECMEAGAVDTIQVRDSIFRLERRYLMIAFGGGRGSYDSIPVVRINTKGVIDTIYSNPLSFMVKYIDIDKDFKPYDIKNIKTYPSLLWLWILLGAAGAGLLAWLAVWLLKKYVKPKNTVARQKINPYEWAVAELSKLQNSNLASSRTKEYYSRLTDVVREYIELQTDLSIMEKTSEEILALMPSTIFSSPELVKYLASLFQTADLVKFAKYPAILDECRANMLDAQNFITESNIVVNELKQSQNQNEEHTSGHTSI
ncbi:MAG: hypothetical protein LBD59_00370 [Prevotellaceae bacterium]|jgi:hypothetical protein|nr:hypothetical protein [Prevotellaceae bacterium]